MLWFGRRGSLWRETGSGQDDDDDRGGYSNGKHLAILGINKLGQLGRMRSMLLSKLDMETGKVIFVQVVRKELCLLSTGATTVTAGRRTNYVVTVTVTVTLL
jgi:hypothetical protein